MVVAAELACANAKRFKMTGAQVTNLSGCKLAAVAALSIATAGAGPAAPDSGFLDCALWADVPGAASPTFMPSHPVPPVLLGGHLGKHEQALAAKVAGLQTR